MTAYDEKLKKCREYIRSVSGHPADPEIKILKGGPYKIKSYYLENNDLDDIRGASANLEYVGNEVIPDIIRNRFDESCIIYNGGGNIFCILPPDTESDFALELESEAQKYLVSANVAYVIVRTRFSSLQNYYHYIAGRLEEILNRRKNMKIAIDFKPKSVFFKTGIPWSDGTFINLNAKEFNGKEVCFSCKSRLACYELLPEETKVCGSCLHKKRIGEYVRKSEGLCNSLSDIDTDYVALIYGDGNNMGLHIQDVKKITGMMEFSDTVKSLTSEMLLETIEKLGIQKCKIVGSGGDDVFVIISGKKAMEFTNELMDKFYRRLSPSYEEFYNEDIDKGYSSMSFGICIAKPDTPIRVMLETAEKKLETAKFSSMYTYGKVDTRGQRAFAVLDSQTNLTDDKKTKFGALATLQSYSKEEEYFLSQTAKSISKQGKTALVRQLYNTYCNADTADEAYLFFQYQNAKEPRPEYKISIPNDEFWISYEKGLYKRWDGEGFLWKDVLDWLVFSGEEEHEE